MKYYGSTAFFVLWGNYLHECTYPLAKTYRFLKKRQKWFVFTTNHGFISYFFYLMSFSGSSWQTLFLFSSCWIKNRIVFYITAVGYFSVIFLINISMFIVVLIQLCRIKKKKQLGAQRKTSIQDLRSVAGLTFLLGITWGFAFFTVNDVFTYLFTIFNTLQGKSMFCVSAHCLRYNEQNIWKWHFLDSAAKM